MATYLQDLIPHDQRNDAPVFCSFLRNVELHRLPDELFSLPEIETGTWAATLTDDAQVIAVFHDETLARKWCNAFAAGLLDAEPGTILARTRFEPLTPSADDVAHVMDVPTEAWTCRQYVVVGGTVYRRFYDEPRKSPVRCGNLMVRVRDFSRPDEKMAEALAMGWVLGTTEAGQ